MTFAPHMIAALKQAEIAAQLGEVPVGAVILDSEGTIIAQAHNLTRTNNDPTAHAEILAIQRASRALGKDRLEGCTLYVTLEPCAMCAGAIAHARIKRVVYGASDPKSGGTDNGARVFTHPQSHHHPEVVSGISEVACAQILKDFFTSRR